MLTMRAARFYGNRDIRVEDVPVPEAGPGECVVEVEWCGICGSDLHEYAAGMSTLLEPAHETTLSTSRTHKYNSHQVSQAQS